MNLASCVNVDKTEFKKLDLSIYIYSLEVRLTFVLQQGTTDHHSGTRIHLPILVPLIVSTCVILPKGCSRGSTAHYQINGVQSLNFTNTFVTLTLEWWSVMPSVMFARLVVSE